MVGGVREEPIEARTAGDASEQPQGLGELMAWDEPEVHALSVGRGDEHLAHGATVRFEQEVEEVLGELVFAKTHGRGAFGNGGWQWLRGVRGFS